MEYGKHFVQRDYDKVTLGEDARLGVGDCVGAALDWSLHPTRRVVFVFAVLVIPVVQLVQSLLTLYRLPAFWRFYADPPYMYLFNALSLGTGLTPQHVDHPGTSLQWLMAGVEYMTFQVSGSEASLPSDIAWNPEKYLNATGVTLSLLFAASVAFFMWRVFLYVGAWPAVIAGLLILAASGLTVPWIVTATPEAVVAACTLMILGLLMPALVDRSTQLKWPVLLCIGALLAIGVTAKIIILPLALLFIFVLRIRNVVILAGTAAVASIVILIPVFELFPRMFGWFTNLARSSGRYGGESPSSVVSNIQAGLATVTREFGMTWVILAVFLVLLVVSFRRPAAGIDWHLRVPAMGLAATSLTTIAVSFKESTDRDFILLVGLIPALAALMVVWIQRIQTVLPSSRAKIMHLSGRVGAAALVLATAVANYQSFVGINEVQKRSAREVATLERASQGGGVTAHAFLAQNEFFALMLGSEWAHHPYSDRVIERFPANLYYNVFLSTVFGKRSDGSIGYLDCSDFVPLVESSGLLFVLPGDFGAGSDRETPGAIVLADGSFLTYAPTAVDVFDGRLSSVPIDGCLPPS